MNKNKRLRLANGARRVLTLLAKTTFLFLALALSLQSDPALAQASQKIVFEDQTSVYHMESVGKDIYAFISPEPKVPIVTGNSLAIIGSDAVLVVDSGDFPALTQRMIADIKSKTDKPVRYLVNTHWHSDHTFGNSFYAAAFPGITIISTPFTREAMDSYGPQALTMAQDQYPRALESYRKALQEGKNFDGTPMTEEDKRVNSGVVEVLPRVIKQLKDYQCKYVGPNLTYSDQMEIDLGGRRVKIFWAGNANTGGDSVVYVPDQKLLATGDILVWPSPFATNSYISSWIKVLDRLLAMDVDTIIPGHGPVFHDKTYMQTVRNLLSDLRDQTKQAISQGLSLEDVKKKVTMQSYADDLNQGIPSRVYSWDNFFLGSAIESVWNEEHGIPINEDPFPKSQKK